MLSTAIASLPRKSQPRRHLIQHACGYRYCAISLNRVWEILMLHWNRGQTSEPHCHQSSFNLTRVMAGKLLERKYRISGGQLSVASERVVVAGQWSWTLPFQIHELVSLCDETRTLHLYLPGRVATSQPSQQPFSAPY